MEDGFVAAVFGGKARTWRVGLLLHCLGVKEAHGGWVCCCSVLGLTKQVEDGFVAA